MRNLWHQVLATSEQLDHAQLATPGFTYFWASESCATCYIRFYLLLMIWIMCSLWHQVLPTSEHLDHAQLATPGFPFFWASKSRLCATCDTRFYLLLIIWIMRNLRHQILPVSEHLNHAQLATPGFTYFWAYRVGAAHSHLNFFSHIYVWKVDGVGAAPSHHNYFLNIYVWEG